jgi:hypothetical protein
MQETHEALNVAMTTVRSDLKNEWSKKTGDDLYDITILCMETLDPKEIEKIFGRKMFLIMKSYYHLATVLVDIERAGGI